jgi:hypothetical protein
MKPIRWGTAVALGFGLGFSILVVANRSRTDDSTASITRVPDSPSVVQNALPGPGGAPFLHASEFLTLDQADAEATANLMTLPRPSTGVASDATITSVWVQTDDATPLVRITYASGVTLGLDSAPDKLSNPAAAKALYGSMAKEDAVSTEGRAAVVDLDGTPAYLIPDGAAVLANGESQGAPGALQLIVSGYSVGISGHVTTMSSSISEGQ